MYTNYVSEFFISHQNIPDIDDDDDDDLNDSDAIAGLVPLEEGGMVENISRGYSIKWPTVLDRRIVYYKK